MHESDRSWCDRCASPARASSPPGLGSRVGYRRESADTEQNKLGLEVTPFEWGGVVHEIGSSQFSAYRRVYCILAIFATQPSEAALQGRDALLSGVQGCYLDCCVAVWSEKALKPGQTGFHVFLLCIITQNSVWHRVQAPDLISSITEEKH